jgi:hypothetical protein
MDRSISIAIDRSSLPPSFAIHPGFPCRTGRHPGFSFAETVAGRAMGGSQRKELGKSIISMTLAHWGERKPNHQLIIVI